MIKMIIDKFNSMEEKTKKILKYGIIFSCFICILAVFILLTYKFNNVPDLFHIGLSTFRLGIFFIVEFLISAIAIDTIKKQAL